ncbi:hypothetical protein SAMN06265347_109143 [Halobellus salinus]|nr:hypothetical protein SAMN06265347_109143 [Halobellus salinus]
MVANRRCARRDRGSTDRHVVSTRATTEATLRLQAADRRRRRCASVPAGCERPTRSSSIPMDLGATVRSEETRTRPRARRPRRENTLTAGPHRCVEARPSLTRRRPSPYRRFPTEKRTPGLRAAQRHRRPLRTVPSIDPAFDVTESLPRSTAPPFQSPPDRHPGSRSHDRQGVQTPPASSRARADAGSPHHHVAWSLPVVKVRAGNKTFAGLSSGQSWAHVSTLPSRFAARGTMTETPPRDAQQECVTAPVRESTDRNRRTTAVLAVRSEPRCTGEPQ